jgi:hypothetical protein
MKRAMDFGQAPPARYSVISQALSPSSMSARRARLAPSSPLVRNREQQQTQSLSPIRVTSSASSTQKELRVRPSLPSIESLISPMIENDPASPPLGASSISRKRRAKNEPAEAGSLVSKRGKLGDHGDESMSYPGVLVIDFAKINNNSSRANDNMRPGDEDKDADEPDEGKYDVDDTENQCVNDDGEEKMRLRSCTKKAESRMGKERVST